MARAATSRKNKQADDLHRAIATGKVSAALSLIRRDPPCDVNAADVYGQTPLILAICAGLVPVMEVLLDKGANMEAVDPYGRRALHNAIMYRKESAAVFLIQRGCDVDAPDERGSTPLIETIKMGGGMKQVMEALVAKGANMEASDKTGGTALYYAIKENQRPTALFLIHQGCDVNATDGNGNPLLLLATESGMKQVVKALMERGADMEAADTCGRRALHHAIERRQESRALFLIRRDPPCDVNAADVYGQTPLMAAARAGLVPVMEALLDKGANMEAVDKYGRKALHNAIMCRKESAAVFLIQRGCDVDAPDERGSTPLIETIKMGGMKPVMEALVAKGANMEASDETGGRALHYAIGGVRDPCGVSLIRQGCEADALSLIRHGCDVIAPDGDGNPPLFLAAEYGMKQVVKALMERGADVEAVDSRGKRLLHRAIMYQQESIALFLIKREVNMFEWDDASSWAAAGGMMKVVTALEARGARVVDNGEGALGSAIVGGHVPAALLLIQRGCNVNAPEGGTTPLMLAAERGLVKVMEALVDRGANMEAVNESRQTALHIALYKYVNQESAAVFLIRRGCGVSNRWCDSTPLSMAIDSGMAEAAKALVERGADLEAVDGGGWRPLHHAIERRRESIALFLIEAGCEVDVQIKFNGTPLVLAAKSGMVEVMKALLARGADMEAVNASGKTALHHAIEKRQKEAALFLVQHNCNIHARTKKGMDALGLAVDSWGMGDVAELLVVRGADYSRVKHYEGMKEILRRVLPRARRRLAKSHILNLRLLYKARALVDATQATRKAREDAAKNGLGAHEQQEKAVAAAPAFLKKRLAAGVGLPRVEVNTARGQSQKELVHVIQHLVGVGLPDDLWMALMELAVSSEDSARRGKPLGHMIERWNEWEAQKQV